METKIIIINFRVRTTWNREVKVNLTTCVNNYHRNRIYYNLRRRYFKCLCIISDVRVLYNSDYSFGERLYGPLDVDLCRVKLHEPLSIIVQQPLLYVRDMVPRPCFEALVKLYEVG